MAEITDRDFSVDDVISRMDNPEVGAVIAYVGVVRSYSEGGEVAGMEFDADETAISRIRALEERALEDFDVKEVAIVHRVGKLKVGDKLLLVAISTAHRQSAFAACTSIIDAIRVIHFTWAKEYCIR
jgi:molybdopterin synthase catalytic subunit